jgi:hypothetical protein
MIPDAHDSNCVSNVFHDVVGEAGGGVDLEGNAKHLDPVEGDGDVHASGAVQQLKTLEFKITNISQIRLNINLDVPQTSLSFYVVLT